MGERGIGHPVVTYLYRCPEGAETEARAPIGTAPGAVPCACCGAPAARVLLAPRVLRGPSDVARLIDGTERSASEPEVVAAPAPARRRPLPCPDPATRRLPRP